jgi:hypothetical protein
MKKTYSIIGLLTVLLIGISCESSVLEPAVDCSSSTLILNLVAKSDAHCGQADGSLEVQGNGGEGPFQYSLNSGSFQSSGLFTNLTSGNYTVNVKDANECTSTLQVSILNEDGVNMSTNIADSGCGTAEGQIVITATGGVEPYTYSINGGAFGSDNTFAQLEAGSYTVVTKDASNCETSENVTVLSGISFNSSVAQIISSSCATSGCHAGSQSPNLSTFSNIQQFADRIKARTSAKTMPPGGGLSDAEIEAIACWVNDGALDN